MPWGSGVAVAGTGLTGAVKNAYVPQGGFTKWGAALASAQAGSGFATAWVYSASIGAGGTATTDMLTKPYFPKWRNKIVTANSGLPVGDTMIPTASAGFNSVVTYSAVPFALSVAPATWTSGGGFVGPWPVPLWTTQTTNPILAYTHPSAALGYNARSIRLFYYDSSVTTGRTWSANIDGGANSNVTAVGDNKIHTLDFTGLTNVASHVLNIGNQGAASIAVIPYAVASYSTTTIPTSGLHFGWFGVPGSFSLSDLAYTGGTVADHIALLIGPSNASAPFTSNSALNPPFAPDLVFLDAFDDIAYVPPNGPANSGSSVTYTVTGGSPAMYLHALRRILQSLRAKATGCDVVHHLPNFPDGVVSDNNPGATYQLWNSWHYYSMIIQIAQAFGNGYLNTDAEWGERGDTLTFLTGNNPHPTDAGHNDIFTRIGSRLGL